MSSPDQLRIIHGLVRQLGMNDSEYRDMLSTAFGKESAKNLSYDQADTLIRRLRTQAVNTSRQKYDDLEGRPGMASPRQLRMIEAMWKDVSRVRSVEARAKALDELLKNRLSIHLGLLTLESKDVQRVRRLLEAMKSGKAEKEATHADEP